MKIIFIRSWGICRNKSFQFGISQKWLEISTPKFHQLLTSMKTLFVQKIKVIGAQNLDFPPKTSKTSNGRGRPNFWAMPLKFGENWHWSKLQKCWNFHYDILNGFRLRKNQCECSVHILKDVVNLPSENVVFTAVKKMKI